MSTIEIRAYGTPRPKGSKKAFLIRNKAKQVVGASTVEQGGENLKDWMALVQAAALEAYDGPLLTGPVTVDITYYFARPKSHFRSGKFAGQLKDSAPQRHTTRPDRDKLDRAVHDALHTVVYADDSQSDRGSSAKAYADNGMKPGARIVIATGSE